jgi:nucleoside-diphosphate-sugar epimerase
LRLFLLIHFNRTPILPQRTVVIGGGGFVGGAVVARLRAKDASVVSVARSDVDLLASNAAEKLTGLLQPGDAIVAAAAQVPCKDMNMLIDNMVMIRTMLDALARAEPSHIVNISSDAVYPDQPLPLSEKIPPAPATLHGAMHLVREIGFTSQIKSPLAHLRLTLTYGFGDPHNGYGPNRFLRQANARKDLVLFGEGEECRDHVFIEDVADLIVRVLEYRSRGILNVATGAVHSFRDIAKKAIELNNNKASIVTQPRQGPMPHNGYRPFDISALRAAFPDFDFTPLSEGMARVRSAMSSA